VRGEGERGETERGSTERRRNGEEETRRRGDTEKGETERGDMEKGRHGEGRKRFSYREYAFNRGHESIVVYLMPLIVLPHNYFFHETTIFEPLQYL